MRGSRLCFLLLPGLLAARAGYAQQAQQVQPHYQPPMTYRSSPLPRQAPELVVIAPTIPVDANGSIKTEPDSATRRLYTRNRVRTVLKVRLDAQGQVQDTLEYQQVDRQGRWTQAGSSPGQVHRQWSYNSAGQCTALVEYAHHTRFYTVINTYNPVLRRGQMEVLQPNGTRTLVREKQLHQSGDTLLTEIRAHKLTVSHDVYPEYVQRSFRLVPHPDTTLSLTFFYDKDQHPSGYQLDYLLYQHGRLVEAGKVNRPKAAPAAKATGTQLPGAAQVVAALRQGAGLAPHDRRFYDSQHQLIRQEITISGKQPIRHTIRFTYNTLGQLIGREGGFTGPGASAQTVYSLYTVYSYSASGLPAGEITNARSGTPVFYRYQYQYYD